MRRWEILLAGASARIFVTKGDTPRTGDDEEGRGRVWEVLEGEARTYWLSLETLPERFTITRIRHIATSLKAPTKHQHIHTLELGKFAYVAVNRV